MHGPEGYPARVRIVEVGPRDGLQNEPDLLPVDVKARFVRALGDAGMGMIEVTSFVNPRRIPQMADAFELMQRLGRRAGVVHSALVPNMKGLERAAEAGVGRIAVFTAASDTFTRRNIGQDVATSLTTLAPVVAEALHLGMTVRGYVSTCFACPYEGVVAPERVREVSLALLHMGVDEVSLGDTIGVAVPRDVHRLLDALLPVIAVDRIALHLHDTSGTALANVMAGLERGVATYDASAGGLGGCPYAPGATGNLATEDLVYLLDGMGIPCGVDLEALAAASRIIQEALGRPLPSRQLRRLASRGYRCPS